MAVSTAAVQAWPTLSKEELLPIERNDYGFVQQDQWRQVRSYCKGGCPCAATLHVVPVVRWHCWRHQACWPRWGVPLPLVSCSASVPWPWPRPGLLACIELAAHLVHNWEWGPCTHTHTHTHTHTRARARTCTCFCDAAVCAVVCLAARRARAWQPAGVAHPRPAFQRVTARYLLTPHASLHPRRYPDQPPPSSRTATTKKLSKLTARTLSRRQQAQRCVWVPECVRVTVCRRARRRGRQLLAVTRGGALWVPRHWLRVACPVL